MISNNGDYLNMDACRRHLAYHEAGHWIVAKAAGFKVGEIVLTVHGYLVNQKKNTYCFRGVGSSHINPEPSLISIKDVDDYLLKRMAVLTAGVSAQKVVDERDIEEIWTEYAADDRGKLNELSFILRGIRFSDDISSDSESLHRAELLNEAGELAKALLEDNLQALNEVSEYLIQGVGMSNKAYKFVAEKLEDIFKRHHG